MEVIDVPVPSVMPGHLLVETSRTLVSSGTERKLVEFERASLLEKVRLQKATALAWNLEHTARQTSPRGW